MTTKIQKLEEKIKTARTNYYNGLSTISDQVYDAMIDELEKLDPKNPQVIGIGAEPISQWKKIKHKVILGSLFKAQTNEEYEKWHNKYIDKDDDVFCSLKIDGLTILLTYDKGKLISAGTRGGDSGQGENILSNVIKMINVPLRLSKKITCYIRGEIVLSKENYAKYFTEYSSIRNVASGVSRKFDGIGCDKLNILTYELITNDLNLQTKEEEFKSLQDLGFHTPNFYILKTAKEVNELKSKYHNSLRDKYEYQIDGIVARQNNNEKHVNVGMTDFKPKGSIAIKFDSVAKIGIISKIDNQVGNSGRVVPVASFYPKIDLGAEIERATLHNYSNIEELGIDIGAKVLVTRANDVIPFISEVVESTGTTFQKPTACPECNADLIETGEYLQCPNSQSCPAQVMGKIENWIKELDIMNWGPSVIEKIIASGKVNKISDLYRITMQDIFGLPRMGETSAKKCYNNLWSIKEIPLDKFIAAISIPMIGTSSMKLVIAAGYNTLDKLHAAKASDFEQIQGLGPIKAKSLEKGLADNKEMIEKILERGISVKTEEEKKIGKLTGKSFCFTGKAENKRSVLEKMVVDNGGEVKSVTKGLSYLVTNDEDLTTSKFVKAKTLGTTIITEKEFISLLN